MEKYRKILWDKYDTITDEELLLVCTLLRKIINISIGSHF
jgi:hypothetical protein